MPLRPPQPVFVQIPAEPLGAIAGDQAFLCAQFPGGPGRQCLGPGQAGGHPTQCRIGRHGLFWRQQPTPALRDLRGHRANGVFQTVLRSAPLELIEVQCVSIVPDTLPGHKPAHLLPELRQTLHIWCQEHQHVAEHALAGAAGFQDFLSGAHSRRIGVASRLCGVRAQNNQPDLHVVRHIGGTGGTGVDAGELIAAFFADMGADDLDQRVLDRFFVVGRRAFLGQAVYVRLRIEPVPRPVLVQIRCLIGQPPQRIAERPRHLPRLGAAEADIPLIHARVLPHRRVAE